MCDRLAKRGVFRSKGRAKSQTTSPKCMVQCVIARNLTWTAGQQAGCWAFRRNLVDGLIHNISLSRHIDVLFVHSTAVSERSCGCRVCMYCTCRIQSRMSYALAYYGVYFHASGAERIRRHTAAVGTKTQDSKKKKTVRTCQDPPPDRRAGEQETLISVEATTNAYAAAMVFRGRASAECRRVIFLGRPLLYRCYIRPTTKRMMVIRTTLLLY